MPRIKQTERHAFVAERKGRILKAAAKVFARKGFERATIADIAAEASVAEGSIYNYFKNKSDLLVSIPRQFVQPAVQRLTSEAAANLALLPPEQFLTMVARTMLGVVQQNIDIIRVVMSSLPTMNRATQAKYVEQVPLYAIGMLETYFRAQIAAAVFRADMNPVLAARLFPGLLIPTILIQEVLPASDAARIEYDVLIAEAVTLFLRGTLAEQQPPHPDGHRRKAEGRKQKAKGSSSR